MRMSNLINNQVASSGHKEVSRTGVDNTVTSRVSHLYRIHKYCLAFHRIGIIRVGYHDRESIVMKRQIPKCYWSAESQVSEAENETTDVNANYLVIG